MFKKLKEYIKQRDTFNQHMFYFFRVHSENFYLSDFKPKIETKKKNGIWTCKIKGTSVESIGSNKNKFMSRQEAMENYIKQLNGGRLLLLPIECLFEMPSAAVSIPEWKHPFYWKEYEALSVWEEFVGVSGKGSIYDYVDFNSKPSTYESRTDGVGECPVCHSEVPSGVFVCPNCRMLCGSGTRRKD